MPVFDQDSILVSVESPDSTHQILRFSSLGEPLGQVTSGAGSFNQPWVSRDGSVVGFVHAPPGDDQPAGRIMAKTTEGITPFIEGETEGVDCRLRATWDPLPTSPRVVLNCIENIDGDGATETSLWEAPVLDGVHADGSRLKPVLDNDDPTQTSPEGSPGSSLLGVSFLPDGAISVNYSGGREQGIHVVERDEVPRRLTSGPEDAPVASPVAQLIAFTRNGDLYVVSADGGRPPCPAPRTRSRDDVTGVKMCNLTGGWTTPPEAIAWQPAWSWDGSKIVMVIGDEDGPSTLALVSLEEGSQPQPIIDELRGPPQLALPAWGPR